MRGHRVSLDHPSGWSLKKKREEVSEKGDYNAEGQGHREQNRQQGSKGAEPSLLVRDLRIVFSFQVFTHLHISSYFWA